MMHYHRQNSCKQNVKLFVGVSDVCFFNNVMFSNSYKGQSEQRSQVSKIALSGCSLNAFVIVIVFVFVFLLVRSCFIITLIKCLKGHKYQRLLFQGVL